MVSLGGKELTPLVRIGLRSYFADAKPPLANEIAIFICVNYYNLGCIHMTRDLMFLWTLKMGGLINPLCAFKQCKYITIWFTVHQNRLILYRP